MSVPLPGYLLDVNHVDPFYRKDARIVSKVASLGHCWIRICSVTLGEIKCGQRITACTDTKRRDEYTAWLHEKMVPHILPVSEHAGIYYAEIVGGIWRNDPPVSPSTRTEVHLVKLGVDINDVWTAAVALEHGLTLVTTDKMESIHKAGTSLKFDNWL